MLKGPPVEAAEEFQSEKMTALTGGFEGANGPRDSQLDSYWGEKSQAKTPKSCPSSFVERHLPPRTSKSFSKPSEVPVTMSDESGLNAQEVTCDSSEGNGIRESYHLFFERCTARRNRVRTVASWPVRVRLTDRLATSHITRVSSSLPVASIVSEGENVQHRIEFEEGCRSVATWKPV